MEENSVRFLVFLFDFYNFLFGKHHFFIPNYYKFVV